MSRYVFPCLLISVFFPWPAPGGESLVSSATAVRDGHAGPDGVPESGRRWQLSQYGHQPAAGEFRCRAFWGGSIFTAQYGPWDLGAEPSTDPEVQWRRTIAWCAESGIDTLIAGAGWGNMRELLSFDKHRAARTLSAEATLANRRRVNGLLAYARQQGVRVLFHSYNFHAPQQWLDANPNVRRKQDRYIGVSLARAGYADNLCWRDVTYRQFLVDCWDELFEVCPDLGGLIITVGEANKCDHCLPQMDAVAQEFLEAFAQVTQGHGRAGWVRTWHFRKFPTQHPDVTPAPILNVHTHPERYVPDGLVYVMKYSHTDCVDVEPDPGIVQAWKAHGKTLLLHLSMYGENSSSSHRWASPRLQHRLVERARRAGADGIVIGSQNTGSENCPDAPYWMNPLALVYYAGRPVPYDAGMWRDYLAALYLGTEDGSGVSSRDGPQDASPEKRPAEDLPTALLSVFDRWAEAALSTPRVYGQSQEGFTFGWGYATARIGSAEWDPPYWWQEDLLGAYEFLQHLKAHGYDPAAINDLAAGRTLFSDYAVDQFRKIDAAFGDLESLPATGLEPRARERLAKIRDDLSFWRLFQFQTAWLLQQRMLTMAIEYARSSEIEQDLRRRLDQWNHVLAGWVLGGLVDLQPAGDFPDDVVRRLAQATARGADRTIGTSFLADLADSREMIERGYLRLSDGAMQVPAVWMALDGNAAHEGYFPDGEFIKIGPPGVFSIAGGTRGTARWTFPDAPGRYEITVHYFDDKDDRGRPGAKSVLAIDGRPVLEWEYQTDDDGIHAVRGEAGLETGSLVRIDSHTEPNVAVAAEYCRIRSLTLKKID